MARKRRKKLKKCKDTSKISYSSYAKAMRVVSKYSELKKAYFCHKCEGFHTTKVDYGLSYEQYLEFYCNVTPEIIEKRIKYLKGKMLFNFKAKRRDTEAWVEGDYITIKIPIFPNLKPPFILNQKGIWEVIPETVCQFTSLLDKNKGLVYDGDFCSHPDLGLGYVKFSATGKFVIIYPCEQYCLDLYEDIEVLELTGKNIYD